MFNNSIDNNPPMFRRFVYRRVLLNLKEYITKSNDLNILNNSTLVNEYNDNELLPSSVVGWVNSLFIKLAPRFEHHYKGLSYGAAHFRDDIRVMLQSGSSAIRRQITCELNKDPEDRFASYDDVNALLSRLDEIMGENADVDLISPLGERELDKDVYDFAELEQLPSKFRHTRKFKVIDLSDEAEYLLEILNFNEMFNYLILLSYLVEKLNSNKPVAFTQALIAMTTIAKPDSEFEDPFTSVQYLTLPIGVLYLMKKSHTHLIKSFDKLVKHCKYIELLEDLLKVTDSFDSIKSIEKDVLADLNNIYKNMGIYDKTPSLNKTKKSFFDDKVVKYYDHDQLHELFAHYEVPAYTLYLKDNEQVLCDKDKFFRLTETTRQFSVLEEAYVIASERKLIPAYFDDTFKPWSTKQALEWALMRIATNLTGGWYRQYAQDNFLELVKIADYNYHKKLAQAICTNKLTPLRE